MSLYRTSLNGWVEGWFQWEVGGGRNGWECMVASFPTQMSKLHIFLREIRGDLSVNQSWQIGKNMVETVFQTLLLPINRRCALVVR